MTQEELWYLNRGTGVVLLALLAGSMVLGVLSTGRLQSRGWPRFLTQGLHRNMSLLAMVLTVVHAGVAVIDEFVDIRWWHAVVPFTGTYQPMWLTAGTLSFNVMIAVTITSVLRHRLSLRWWRGIHLLSYVAFALGVVHGIGIGTDASEPWSVAVTVTCSVAVVLALVMRLASLRRGGAP